MAAGTKFIATRPSLVETFGSAMQALPFVQRVLVDDIHHVGEILTIITAEPFDPEPRRRVYEAQLAALEQAGFPPVHFSLVNVRELCDDASAVAPATYQTVFQRS